MSREEFFEARQLSIDAWIRRALLDEDFEKEYFEWRDYLIVEAETLRYHPYPK